jgi:hypothetical protein
VEFSEFINIIEFIKHLFSRDFHVAEDKSAVVNPVQTNFNTHIFDENTWHWFHVVVSDLDEEAINSLIFAFDDRLSKDNCPISMASSISNPVFL